MAPEHFPPMAHEHFSTPPFSIMEAMFFNYLYTLFASYSSYSAPQPSTSPARASSDDDEPLSKKIKQEVWNCSFCSKEYKSEHCLFYKKHDAGFKENVSVCLCCGEDEEESEKDSDDVKSSPEKDNKKVESKEEIKTEDEGEAKEEGILEVKEEADDDDKSEKEPEKQKISLNPGWYGRGYRKRIKKKR